MHMLQMLWTGEQAEVELKFNVKLDLDVEMVRAASELRDHGIEHRDVRAPQRTVEYWELGSVSI